MALRDVFRVVADSTFPGPSPAVVLDLILTSRPNCPSPASLARPSETFEEGMLLSGGRERVSFPGPGARDVILSGANRIPDGIRPGAYYLGAVVDAGNTVAETNETNNCSFCRLEIGAGQFSVVPSVTTEPAARAEITGYAETCIRKAAELTIRGNNFGSQAGKGVALGGHGIHVNLTVLSWSDGAVRVRVPDDPRIAEGRSYYTGIQTADGGRWLSNINKGLPVCSAAAAGASSPACSTSAPAFQGRDETYRYLVQKPWYRAGSDYRQHPGGHLEMFRKSGETGAFARYLAEFWGPYGAGKVKSTTTGGNHLEFYCDNVKAPQTAQPGVNCLCNRPRPDQIENVFFFATGNSGWAYGPNLAASTVKTDEDPFRDGEYERIYDVHNDGWFYFIIKERARFSQSYRPDNTLLAVAPHPGYPWNIDDKAGARADFRAWLRDRTANFRNVKRVVVGGYSRGGVLALALGRELRQAFFTRADWYSPGHTEGVKLVVLALDPGGSQPGDGLELKDSNMNIPNDGGGGSRYGSGHCHRLDIAYDMGINENQSNYWVRTYVKNVIGESIYMDCLFHKANCDDRGDHQREYKFCIDGHPWDGDGAQQGCPGQHNPSTWLKQHISTHDRNNHGDMGTHSRPELVEHYLNFMSYWFWGQARFFGGS
jgi:hypothetical protein